MKAGGKAVAAVASVEDGDAIVKVALEKFGGVHILVANAGILRDKSFTTLSEREWDAVLAVHLRCVILFCSAFRYHLMQYSFSQRHVQG